MIPDSTAEAIWIGHAHNSGHDCGSLHKGCSRNIEETVSVCVGVESCLLATGYLEFE